MPVVGGDVNAAARDAGAQHIVSDEPAGPMLLAELDGSAPPGLHAPAIRRRDLHEIVRSSP
jgi:hypothetical protein